MKTITKPKTLDDYLALIYPITLYPEPEGGYTVMIKDLPGCISVGETLEEAIENINDAKQSWLETAWEFHDRIPLPSDDLIQTIDN